jgi:PncC family amidohydrolase
MNAEVMEMVRCVHELFSEKRLTLALAESCTGGLISHYMTFLPGSSAFFQAGLVTYSNASKINILGLSPSTIEQYGVISGEVAREMAERARSLLKTDYAVATTGNLGPEVLEEKEMGLVYIAVCAGGETVVRELRLTGDRETNKEKASSEAAQFLLQVAKVRSFVNPDAC